jgi:tetratricopeptide (TPR) repeat protein
MQEALQLANQIGDLLHLCELKASPIPLYHLHNGYLDAACQSLEEGVSLAERIGHLFGVCIGSLILGRIAQLRGEFERAIPYLERSLEAGRLLGLPLFEAFPLGVLCSVYQEYGETFKDQIIDVRKHALDLLNLPIGMPAGGFVWDQLGFCFLSEGDLDSAEELFERGISSPSIHKIYNHPRFLAGLASVALARGRITEALQYIDEAGRFAEEHELKHLFPEAALVKGRVCTVAGDLGRALESLEEAESLAAAMGMRPVLWQARLEAARVLSILGQEREAEKMRRDAGETLGEIGRSITDRSRRTAFQEHAQHKIEKNPFSV